MLNAIGAILETSALSVAGDPGRLSEYGAAPRRLGVGDCVNDGLLLEVQLWPKGIPQIHVCARSIQLLMARKTVLVFGISGAHGFSVDRRIDAYARACEELRALGVDEVWCVAIQNPFVLGAWGLERKVWTRLRLMSDRDGSWTSAMGFAFPQSAAAGQATALPYAFIAVDGVIRVLCRDEKTSHVDAFLANLKVDEGLAETSPWDG